MPRTSIRLKLFLSIILLLIISYVTLIYTTIHSFESFIDKEANRELEEHLNFAQRQFLVRADHMRYALTPSASLPELHAAMKNRHRREALSRLMRQWIDAIPFAEIITVIDAEKMVVGRLNEGPTGDRLDIGGLVDQAFRESKAVISTELMTSQQLCREGVKAYCQTREDEAMVNLVVVPVVDQAGTILGGLVAGDVLNQDPFLPFQVKGVFGQETELSIFQRGMRIASSFINEEQIPAILPDAVLSQLKTGRSFRGSTSIGGTSTISSFDPIVNSRSEVIGALSVALSKENLIKIRRESEQNVLLSAALATLLSFSIAYLAARKLTEPLKELSRGVELVERGDLTQRVMVASSDEFGALADSFNRMAGSLAERDRIITKKTSDLEELNALLKELNNLLENKVQERTTELRREMGMLEAILTSMVEGVIVTDHGSRVVLINPAAQKILNIVPHRVLNQPMEKLVDLPGFSQIVPVIEEMREKSSFSSVFVKELEVNGKKLKVSFSPLMEDEGTLAGIVVSIRDITVEEEVDRMKTEFISTVSHELKTPLTSIKGALQFTMTKAKWLTSTERELLSVCLRNTERLIRLVNDILDISKIESGKVALNFKPLSVSDITVYAIEEIKGYALSRNVSIVNSVGDHLPLIYGDNDRLIQVLTNLLSNAVKFSPQWKVIMVSAERQENYVVISVIDHGKEIQWSDRDKLFKKFQQLESSEEDRRGGTGLGLAICKEIVEQHHGKIYYQEGATGGNVFSFGVPVYEEQ